MSYDLLAKSRWMAERLVRYKGMKNGPGDRRSSISGKRRRDSRRVRRDRRRGRRDEKQVAARL